MKQFSHDCSRCIYLFSSYNRDNENVDVYICPHKDNKEASFIARYGNEGYEYASYPYFILQKHDNIIQSNKWIGKAIDTAIDMKVFEKPEKTWRDKQVSDLTDEEYEKFEKSNDIYFAISLIEKFKDECENKNDFEQVISSLRKLNEGI